jgi:hypothetical protein
MPPAEPGQLRDDWQRRAGLVESYREAVGITDPAQAIGPVPAGKAHLAEAFHASVRALELPDEAALLKAMNRGQLEARVQEYVRAETVAPRDVQAELGDREHHLEETRERVSEAHKAGDAAALETAETDAGEHSWELSRLSVADAARREWAEANTNLEDQARAAARELRARGLDERIPVTDAEVAEAETEEREVPAIDPDEWARLKAEQTARVEAERQARAAEAGRQVPVTDAGVAKAEAEPRAFPEIDPAQAAVWEAEQAVRAEAERQARAGEMARRYPVTDTEVAEAEATGRPAESPWIDPEDAARWRAEQTARVEAERQARREASARAYPVTDAEIAKYGPPPAPQPEPEAEPGPEPEPAWRREIIEPQSEIEWKLQYRDAHPELFGQQPRQAEPEPEPEAEPEPATADRDALYAEIHEDLTRCSRHIDELSARMDEEEARRAEAHEEILRQPPVWQAQAEPSLEASWQPGDTSHYEADTDAEAEAELEI